MLNLSDLLSNITTTSSEFDEDSFLSDDEEETWTEWMIRKVSGHDDIQEGITHLFNRQRLWSDLLLLFLIWKHTQRPATWLLMGGVFLRYSLVFI